MTNVSIIMPCRNEEKYVGKCLDSIIANDYPKDGLEILVIDGRSEDRTREIVGEYAGRFPFIRLLDNPKKVQTFATNIGILEAKGDVIIRMDAHAEYPAEYVSRSVHWLKESGADCVGGICITRPGADTPSATAIALALSHPFGVGNSYFRIGSKEPRPVDTVPFGCYRKEVFDKGGLFNENLNRTDDIEFNLRLKRTGRRILLVPDISSVYYARPAFGGLAKQNFGNGFWVLYSLAFVKMPFSVRHLVPLIFVLSLIGGLALSFTYRPVLYLFVAILGLYLAVNAFVAVKLSTGRGVKYFPFLIAAFVVLHLSYGLGSLLGALSYIKAVCRRLLRNNEK